jgi:protocatechuate 3,4-dioxygenase beta subunit
MAERDCLESNIERLLHSVEPELKMPPSESSRILKRLKEAGVELGRSGAFGPSDKAMSGKWVALAAALIILIIALLSAVLLLKDRKPERPITPEPKVTEPLSQDQTTPGDERDVTKPKTKAGDDLDMQVKRVLDMGVAGDVRGLIRVLSEEHFLNKVVAANYLGRIGDEKAIGPLEKASAEWVGDEKDNPFTKAIEQIRARLKESADSDKEAAEKDIADPNLSDSADDVSVISSDAVVIEGYIYDDNGVPEPGVTVYCERVIEYIGRKEIVTESVATAITNEEGFYSFDGLEERLYLVRRSEEDIPFGVSRKAVLAKRGAIRRLNFGTGLVLSGWVRIGGQLLANARLLLADPYDPYNTFFACYTVTDEQGNYIFMGVPTGTYGAYFEPIEQQGTWAKLGKVAVGPEDVTNYGFGAEFATIRATVNSADPNQPVEIVDVYVEQSKEEGGLRVGEVIWPGQESDPYVIENLFSGSYNIVIALADGISIKEPVVLPAGQSEHSVEVNIPSLTASISGVASGFQGEGFVVRSADDKITAAVEPESDGMYFIEPLAAGQYFVEHSNIGQMAPVVEFELSDNEQRIVDIDIDRWLQTQRASVYVYSVDVSGVFVPGPRVWLEGSGVTGKEVTSQGAHFVVAPGPYVLKAEYSDGGYKQASRKVEITAGDIFGIDTVPQVLYITLQAK